MGLMVCARQVDRKVKRKTENGSLIVPLRKHQPCTHLNNLPTISIASWQRKDKNSTEVNEAWRSRVRLWLLFQVWLSTCSHKAKPTMAGLWLWRQLRYFVRLTRRAA